MQFALKKYQHAPAHLYLDEGYYFFTGAVYQKRKLLTTPKTKEIFIEYLFRFIEKYCWELFEWVVLDNHYHFLCKIAESLKMPIVINSLHKTTAFYIKKELNIQVKPFWYQYWDRCIRNDKHYFETATYILYNPIKHEYVEDLKEYPYSSFPIRYQQERENLKANFLEYKPQYISYYDDIDDF
jgi:putative transposase